MPKSFSSSSSSSSSSVPFNFIQKSNENSENTSSHLRKRKYNTIVLQDHSRPHLQRPQRPQRPQSSFSLLLHLAKQHWNSFHSMEQFQNSFVMKRISSLLSSYEHPVCHLELKQQQQYDALLVDFNKSFSTRQWQIILTYFVITETNKSNYTYTMRLYFNYFNECKRHVQEHILQKRKHFSSSYTETLIQIDVKSLTQNDQCWTFTQETEKYQWTG